MKPLNRIAIIDVEGQLATIDPNGRALRPLSNGGYFYQFPAWSPDGQSIAVIGTEERRGGIFIADEPHQPYSGVRSIYESQRQQPFYLYWSPDSRQITFAANHPREGIGLHIVPAGGGSSVSRLLDVGRPYFWAWGEDNQSLFVHSGGGDAKGRLAFMDRPFEYVGENIASPGHFQTPGISPSGKYWAFAAVNQMGTAEVIIEGSNTHRRIKIEHEGAAILSWSRTQDVLAVISPSVETPHFYGMLRLINPDSGNIQTLTDDTVVAFFWSPNGKKIAYFTLTHETESQDGAGQMLRIQEGYARGRQLPEQNNPADVWLDLNVVDLRSERSELITPFRPNPIFLNQYLPFFDQYALSHRIWSPDSKSLVLPVLANGNELIAVVPIDGVTPPLPIAEGIMASWSQS